MLSKNRPEVLFSMGANMLTATRATNLHPLGSLDDHAYVLRDAGIETLVFDPSSQDRARRAPRSSAGPDAAALLRRSRGRRGPHRAGWQLPTARH